MEIFESKKIKSLPAEREAWQVFLQQMTNRRAIGGLRYGPIKVEQKYMSRLQEELKAYKRKGNREQLLNIAVYAFLESYAPEHKNHHFNSNVDSVTRAKFGGAQLDGSNSRRSS